MNFLVLFLFYRRSRILIRSTPHMPTDAEHHEECHTDEDSQEYFNADAGLSAVILQPTLHQDITYREGKDSCYHYLQYVFLKKHHQDVFHLCTENLTDSDVLALAFAFLQNQGMRIGLYVGQKMIKYIQ